MSESVTRHADPPGGWGEALLALMDVTNDIIGGITLLGLPIIVMAPGLLAFLGLGIPLLLPFIALGVVMGILSIPLVAAWWLARLIRRVMRHRRPPRRQEGGGRSHAPAAHGVAG